MNNWLDDLLEEYPTNRSDGAIMRMVRVFSDYDNDTMRKAVDAYMMEGKYFPKVSDLHPYILHALYRVEQQDMEKDKETPEDREARLKVEDEKYLRIEQAAGSMPDDAQLDSEYEECERVRVAA